MQAVVWDYDGTLMDTYPMMTDCLYDALAVHGLRAEKEWLLSAMKETLSYAVEACAARFQTDPVMLLPEQDVIDLLKQWLPTVNHSPLRELRFACYKEGVIYDDGVLKVTAIRTQHIAVSYAFLLEAEGRKVLFTGDLHHGSPTDFPEIAYSTHLDMVFCESAHFPVTEYKPIFAKCDIGKVCIQHYSPRFDSLLRGFIEEMKPLPVVIASDGTEFNL